MKQKWQLTDTWLFAWICIGVLNMAVADNGLYRIISGAFVLFLAFKMMRRVFLWKYRAIGQRALYEDIVKSLEKQDLMVVSTCKICHQSVTDKDQHMRKAHGWSPRPR